MEGRFSLSQFVVIPLPILAGHNQTRAAQVSQMARSGRLRNVENVHEIPDAHLSFGEQMQNAQSRAIGKRSKHQIHLRFRHGSVYSHARFQNAQNLNARYFS